MTFFHFRAFFKKVSYAWPASSTVYNPKGCFLIVISGTTSICSPLNTKDSMQYFILKSLETFLIPNYFYNNVKKYGTKKPGQILICDNRFHNWKILNYFNKVLNSKRRLNQIKYCLTEHIQIWHLFFYKTNIKIFQWLSKSKFVSFMIKVNWNNGDETKSHFPLDVFKYDAIYVLIKKINCFKDVQNRKLAVLWPNWI